MNNSEWDSVFRESRLDKLASRDSQTAALKEALRVLANAGVEPDELQRMQLHEVGHLGVDGLTVHQILAEIQNSPSGRVNAAISLMLSVSPEDLIAAIEAVPKADRSTEDWRTLSSLYFELYGSHGPGGE